MHARLAWIEGINQCLLGHLAPQTIRAQQQRVAVARALVTNPNIVLADEPTANLDSENATALLEMMRRLRDTQNMTFVFSTHDPLVVSYASRVVTLKDGVVVSDEDTNDDGTRES